MSAPCFTLGELAERLGLEYTGDREQHITGIAPLPSAQPGQLSFLSDKRYRKDLASTQASVVIVTAELADECCSHCLISENPYLSYAQVSQWFERVVNWGCGLDTSAIVADSAELAAGVSIAAHCSIGERVVIGANTRIAPGCVIADDCVIGEDCVLHPNVTLYQQVRLGDRVMIHSATVIGSDGFGFAPSKDGWVRIAQLGTVVVGDDVNIGANTAIDRGALADTIIASGVIIDNQVHIAHNCEIGEGSAIAGCSGLAGSSIVGKNCTLAGGVGLAGHLSLTDGVHITGMSMVTKSLTESGAYSSGTTMQDTRSWRKNAVRLSQLDALNKRVAALEKQLKD